MKKLFKSLIPFLSVAVIAWPVWAITIEGGNGSSMQGGSSKMQGNSLKIFAAGGGQSLMGGLFVSQQSNSRIGADNFEAAVIANGGSAVFVAGSDGGTGAVQTSNPTDYWWHNISDIPGPTLIDFKADMSTAGITPNVLVWAQGEQDSSFIPGSTSRPEYKAGLLSIFNNIRATYGDMPVVIQRIGRRTSVSSAGGIQAVREVQVELANENSWIHIGPDSYDLHLYDDVHLLDSPGYSEMGTRLGNRVMNVLGRSVPSAVGPAIASASRSGTSVTVNLTHDSGTDFTPTTAIQGFRFFDDSSEIKITAAVRTNATSITLTLASTPSGVETLYYVYDNGQDLYFSAGDIIDEGFTVDPNWTATGNAAVTGGKLVATIDQSIEAETHQIESFSTVTDAWCSFTLRVTGVSLASSGDSIRGAGILRAGSSRISIGLINDSGTVKWQTTHRTDSGTVTTTIDSPAFDDSRTWKVVMHHKGATCDGCDDGIEEMWLDDKKVLDLQTVDNDTKTDINQFLGGTNTVSTNGAAVFTIDDVKVGTQRAVDWVVKDNAVTSMPLQSTKLGL